MANQPLYLRVKNDLAARIQAGEWQSGDYLPSEQALIEHYRVSRTTVRKAIGDLVVAGRLVIDRGNGTKVAPPKQGLDSLLSITQMIEKDDKKPGLAANEFTTEVIDSAFAELANLPKNTQVLHFYRVHTADDLAISVASSWFDLSIFAGIPLRRVVEEPSIYALLSEAGHAVESVQDRINLVHADQAVAKALDLEVGAPALAIERRGYDAQKQLIEYGQIVYRADRYQPVYITRRN